MLIIFGLMLVLLQTVSCVDRNCSISESEPCYAALGDKLYLQMDTYSKLIIQKESLTCVIKNDTKGQACNLYSNRPDVTFRNNDTMIINNVTRADSGRYTLNITDSQGIVLPTTGLQVNVEAAVGLVTVSVECISEEWVMTCSSKGDSLFFNWTLNGQSQEQENKATIKLNGKTSGNLTCSVKNHISHGDKSITVKHCTGTTTASVTTHLISTVTNSTSVGTSLSGSNHTPTQNPGWFSSLNLEPVHLIGMASAIVILIVLVITVCYIYKKKKQPKSAAADGGTELVYADINHDKLNRDNKPKKTEMSSAADVEYAEVASQRKTKKKKGKEDEVQYGEVSFTPAGRNVQKQHTEQDECVYSQIYQKK